jgi:hypothetical protein
MPDGLASSIRLLTGVTSKVHIKGEEVAVLLEVTWSSPESRGRRMACLSGVLTPVVGYESCWGVLDGVVLLLLLLSF